MKCSMLSLLQLEFTVSSHFNLKVKTDSFLMCIIFSFINQDIKYLPKVVHSVVNTKMLWKRWKKELCEPDRGSAYLIGQIEKSSRTDNTCTSHFITKAIKYGTIQPKMVITEYLNSKLCRNLMQSLLYPVYLRLLCEQQCFIVYILVSFQPQHKLTRYHTVQDPQLIRSSNYQREVCNWIILK